MTIVVAHMVFYDYSCGTYGIYDYSCGTYGIYMTIVVAHMVFI